jgi:hypothetical protein
VECAVCHGELRKNAFGVCQRTRACKLEYMNRYNLKKYGISLADFKGILAAQDGCCAICHSDKSGRRGWHVDHDHQSGVVRGLLCHFCNTAIGSLKDDPELLRAAALYLETNRVRKAA